MFDAVAFLRQNFRDPEGVVSFLGSFGARSPSEMAAHKWFKRGSIPPDWLAILLVHMELERGQPVSLVGYYTRAA